MRLRWPRSNAEEGHGHRLRERAADAETAGRKKDPDAAPSLIYY